ncbi:glutathione S-transferase family protein [Parasphingopyxis lamellibrachiae]|uniref:Glutathione S-transferase n=1 Tax=Parasphingopyxis lamellibrachiae TaxID=680125 RepID=A0A3D9FHQ4_9SPHN|nr:glutathione S-transferase family protein [Parasphingopyxis lamellibrachiae]RED17324.1 glutathione S-transferase [Parasphingopyxis lamellibrachiae]
MKLYQSIGPNPRVATMFIAEKGLEIERQFLDIRVGENRQPDYLALNPHGGTPLLVLDDGTKISESVAICEYLDETHAASPLLGFTPEERAATRQTTRIVDQNIVVPLTNGFRSAEGLPMFKDRLFCCPEAADGNKAYAQDGLKQADAMLAGREYLVGDRFTLADILLFCFVEFGSTVGQSAPAELANLHAWRARVAARPSAALSGNPQNGVAN